MLFFSASQSISDTNMSWRHLSFQLITARCVQTQNNRAKSIWLPLQTTCSVTILGGKENCHLSTVLKHIPRSCFSAQLPVNSTHIKAANCCLHNLQPFKSTNVRMQGSHKRTGSVSLHLPFCCCFSIKNPQLFSSFTRRRVCFCVYPFPRL